MGDINGDGDLDIVFGKYDQSNQLLLNSGDGNFASVQDIPRVGTLSIALADLNGDGMLEAVIGTSDKNLLSSFKFCPNGGIRLHNSSWCFRCPNYMGLKSDVCEECLPDYVQEDNIEICSKAPCFFGERPLVRVTPNLKWK